MLQSHPQTSHRWTPEHSWTSLPAGGDLFHSIPVAIPPGWWRWRWAHRFIGQLISPSGCLYRNVQPLVPSWSEEAFLALVGVGVEGLNCYEPSWVRFSVIDVCACCSLIWPAYGAPGGEFDCECFLVRRLCVLQLRLLGDQVPCLWCDFAKNEG